MAFMESHEFLPLRRYKLERHERINENDVQVGDIYVVAMKLQQPRWRRGQREAAKLALRVCSMESGLLTATMLDQDLKDAYETSGQMHNGLISEFSGFEIVDLESKCRYTPKEGYLRDYKDDGIYGEIATWDELDVRSLVEV